jgi:molybdenum cofactor biosynthesis enzyme MoaA
MSDGILRPCLGDNLEFSLKEALESGDDAALVERIRSAVWEKPETHGFGGPFCTARNMSRIGG